MRARLVFENDSITNIAHQLGYFATIADWSFSRTIGEQLAGVTVDQVSAVAAATLKSSNRTIGWFEPRDVASATSRV